MDIRKKSLVIFCIFLGIGIASGCSLYFIGTSSIRTENVYFSPSIISNWTIEDPTLRLHGRFYYPLGFNPAQKYPTLIMYHGVTRSLEDNDFLARKLAQMGILCFAISFHGHGESNGTFPTDGARYNETFGDTLGSYRYLRNQSFVDTDKLCGFGISLGGGAAVFLALTDLVPKFVVWYPALAYLWGNLSLYQYNSTSSKFQGFIMAGTADECTRCSPDYVKNFTSHNPTVEVQWLEGAKHTDSRFFFTTVNATIAWLSKLWQIAILNWFQVQYYSGYLGIGIGGIIILADLIWGITKAVQNYKKNKNSKPSDSL